MGRDGRGRVHGRDHDCDRGHDHVQHAVFIMTNILTVNMASTVAVITQVNVTP
jgi:hypothetical protein